MWRSNGQEVTACLQRTTRLDVVEPWEGNRRRPRRKLCILAQPTIFQRAKPIDQSGITLPPDRCWHTKCKARRP